MNTVHAEPPGKHGPSLDERLRTLRNEDTGWSYRFDPGLLPSTAHTLWSEADWLRYIGPDNWFQKPSTATVTRP